MTTMFDLDIQRKQLKHELAELKKEYKGLPVNSTERLAIGVTIATLRIELSSLQKQIINSRKNYFN